MQFCTATRYLWLCHNRRRNRQHLLSCNHRRKRQHLLRCNHRRKRQHRACRIRAALWLVHLEDRCVMHLIVCHRNTGRGNTCACCSRPRSQLYNTSGATRLDHMVQRHIHCVFVRCALIENSAPRTRGHGDSCQHALQFLQIVFSFLVCCECGSSCHARQPCDA